MFKKKCSFCDKVGHFKSNCYLFQNQQRQENKNKQSNQRQYQKKFKNSKNTNENSARTAVDSNQEILFSTSKSDKNIWYLHSAATSHMCSNKEFFEKIDYSAKEKIIIANGDSLLTSGKGYGYLQCLNKDGKLNKIKITDIFYIPELHGNLISIKKLDQRGICTNFGNKMCEIVYDGNIVAFGKLNGLLYELELQKSDHNSDKKAKETLLVTKNCQIDIVSLHERLGHRNVESIRSMIKNDLVKGVSISDNKIIKKCETCLKGKIHKFPFAKNYFIKTKNVLDLIHSDLCGPMKNTTPNGGRYFLSFIDDYSRFSCVFIIKNKSEVIDKFIEYVNFVENLFNRSVKILRSDNGGEYVNAKLANYLRSKGIKHETTVPHTPEQNGVAERKNRSLSEMANCMLIQANLELKFWAEAVMTSNYIQIGYQPI